MMRMIIFLGALLCAGCALLKPGQSHEVYSVEIVRDVISDTEKNIRTSWFIPIDNVSFYPRIESIDRYSCDTFIMLITDTFQNKILSTVANTQGSSIYSFENHSILGGVLIDASFTIPRDINEIFLSGRIPIKEGTLTHPQNGYIPFSAHCIVGSEKESITNNTDLFQIKNWFRHFLRERSESYGILRYRALFRPPGEIDDFKLEFQKNTISFDTFGKDGKKIQTCEFPEILPERTHLKFSNPNEVYRIKGKISGSVPDSGLRVTSPIIYLPSERGESFLIGETKVKYEYTPKHNASWKKIKGECIEVTLTWDNPELEIYDVIFPKSKFREHEGSFIYPQPGYLKFQVQGYENTPIEFLYSDKLIHYTIHFDYQSDPISIQVSLQ